MSQILLQKSQFNSDAAVLLDQESYFASSCHCSYYCVIQYLMYIAFKYLGETESSLEIQSRANSLGTHQYLIQRILKELREIKKSKSDSSIKFNYKNNKRDVTYLTITEFNDLTSILKLNRVNSDYREIVIIKEISQESIKNKSAILKILNNIFI